MMCTYLYVCIHILCTSICMIHTSYIVYMLYALYVLHMTNTIQYNTYIHIFTYIVLYVCVCVCVCVCSIHIHIYIYIHICIHSIYIYIYIWQIKSILLQAIHNIRSLRQPYANLTRTLRQQCFFYISLRGSLFKNTQSLREFYATRVLL